MPYTVYLLREPITDLVRYVGFSRCVDRREVKHLTRPSGKPSSPVEVWTARLIKRGTPATLEVVASLDDQYAAEAVERALISFYSERIGPRLLNRRSNPLFYKSPKAFGHSDFVFVGKMHPYATQFQIESMGPIWRRKSEHQLRTA